MKKCIYIVMLLLVSNGLYADGHVQGKITYIQAGKGYTPNDIYILVEMDTPVTGQPACATEQRLALDPSTEHGKVLYAALLSAKQAQSTVEIYGANTCNVMGSRFEDIRYMRLK